MLDKADHKKSGLLDCLYISISIFIAFMIAGETLDGSGSHPIFSDVDLFVLSGIVFLNHEMQHSIVLACRSIPSASHASSVPVCLSPSAMRASIPAMTLISVVQPVWPPAGRALRGWVARYARAMPGGRTRNCCSSPRQSAAMSGHRCEVSRYDAGHGRTRCVRGGSFLVPSSLHSFGVLLCSRLHFGGEVSQPEHHVHPPTLDLHGNLIGHVHVMREGVKGIPQVLGCVLLPVEGIFPSLREVRDTAHFVALRRPAMIFSSVWAAQ
ncbi:hypothetical protein GLX_15840 [Komagataeibacter medellinensis NBRC 3288]|uniref:Uncharacterized protein n=1 Tax=Komagataeibacter medellinensis (strain NBRC 3288 / BCRC 11682 / LMG 1693 / Kondo 51) TaxID=634177 RepID=G2I799_KOMMN|nr:hypothetical protein GLX_15840 [Komagataeibacter medellinensis NBRC 3288]